MRSGILLVEPLEVMITFNFSRGESTEKTQVAETKPHMLCYVTCAPGVEILRQNGDSRPTLDNAPVCLLR